MAPIHFAAARDDNPSQRILVQHLGLVSRAYISDLEAGRKLPSIGVVVQLADLFSVTTDYLLSDDLPLEVLPDS